MNFPLPFQNVPLPPFGVSGGPLTLVDLVLTECPLSEPLTPWPRRLTPGKAPEGVGEETVRNSEESPEDAAG
jgi:hypothetical protein